MDINSVNLNSNFYNISNKSNNLEGTTNSGATFKDFLKNVNEKQLEAAQKQIDFSLNKADTDIHNVMISMAEADLALQLTIEIRDKLIETYREIMRMQV